MHPDWKGRSIFFFFWRQYDCIERPIVSTKELPEQINKFSKFSGDKIIIQKLTIISLF